MRPPPAPIAAIVLEPNRRVGQRIARVIDVATGLGRVVYVPSVDDIRPHLSVDTQLIACGEHDVEDVLAGLGPDYPTLRLLTWVADDSGWIFELARFEPRLSNIVGWPSFQSMPRPWELALCARCLVEPPAPVPAPLDLLSWGAREFTWTPGTTLDRDVVVAEVSELVRSLGVGARIADRASSIAHELLMNAMYDAPVDAHGAPRYAFDRTADLVLGEVERPTLRLATDGMLLCLEVADPFGGLARSDVIDGVLRGRVAHASDDAGDFVDTSHGGAGLGMARLLASSGVLICEVTPGRLTRVLSITELDITAREMRGLPASLHCFTAEPPAAEPDPSAPSGMLSPAPRRGRWD